jgi:putative acetyltransferase
MIATIRRIDLPDAEGFHACLDSVARERRYLAQIEAPPMASVQGFVADSVAHDAAQYVAVADGIIVGWCDVFPHWANATRHAGTLGMGLQSDFRGRGLGRALLLQGPAAWS